MPDQHDFLVRFIARTLRQAADRAKNPRDRVTAEAAARASDPALTPAERQAARDVFDTLYRNEDERGKIKLPQLSPVTRRKLREREKLSRVKARRGVTVDSQTTRGNRYAADADLWAVVKRSGAKSQTEYERWRKSEGDPHLPTYKTLQRRFADRRKPGETAWAAMLRLGRKAGAL